MGKRPNHPTDLARQVQTRMDQIRDDPSLIARYDVTRDGALDEHEWELVRRIVELEVRTAFERGRDTSTEFEPEVLRDRYEMVGRLGRGGQAETYLARDLERDGEHVVAKILEIRVAADWKSIELFEREASVLEGLDHPRIPRYVDHFHLEGDGTVRFVLVQAYVDGSDLGHLVDRGAGWSVDEARRRLDQAAEILSYLHGQNPPVVHRDIKPSNLIVGRDDELYLVDFGAAQNIIPATAGGTTIIGTSGYVPMEQYMGKAIGASDLYALGATAVHLLSGRHPADLELVRSRLQFEKYIDDEHLRHVLGRMLDPHVESRLQDAETLRQLLSEGVPPTSPGTTRTVSPDAIERYLASGIFEGIGDVLAARVVEQFGDDTLDVLSQDPSRIAEVPGVGEAKASAFERDWNHQDVIRSGEHVDWRGRMHALQHRLERATDLARPLPAYVAAKSKLPFRGDSAEMVARFRDDRNARMAITRDGVTLSHRPGSVTVVMWLVFGLSIGLLVAAGASVSTILFFATILAFLPIMGHSLWVPVVHLDGTEIVIYPGRLRYGLSSVGDFRASSDGIEVTMSGAPARRLSSFGASADDEVADALNRALERLRPHLALGHDAPVEDG